MSKTLPDASRPPQPHAAAIHGLHHMAWRCRDAEETRHFYEDLLGLPLFHIIRSDHVPSTGEYCPYTNVFSRLGDGSFVAFFDLGDDTAPAPSPNTPAWVNHLALRVDNLEALERTKTLLETAGIQVLGVTDHRIFKSMYFFDPNGIRLELCAQIAGERQMIEESRSAHDQLAEWTVRKQRWRADRIEAQATAQSSHTG